MLRTHSMYSNAIIWRYVPAGFVFDLTLLSLIHHLIGWRTPHHGTRIASLGLSWLSRNPPALFNPNLNWRVAGCALSVVGASVMRIINDRTNCLLFADVDRLNAFVRATHHRMERSPIRAIRIIRTGLPCSRHPDRDRHFG